MSQERCNGEQPEVSRRRAGDGALRLLLLGLLPQMRTGSVEGDFQLPVRDEPEEDRQRGGLEIGAHERLTAQWSMSWPKTVSMR